VGISGVRIVTDKCCEVCTKLAEQTAATNMALGIWARFRVVADNKKAGYYKHRDFLVHDSCFSKFKEIYGKIAVRLLQIKEEGSYGKHYS